MTPFLGCLGVVGILAVLASEVFSFVVAHRLLGAYARDIIGGANPSDTLLPIIAVQVGLMILGVILVKVTVAQLPMALMGSLMGQGTAAGRLVLRALAGVLLIMPGFFLDVAAILLLLPPVQALLAASGQRIVMAMVRQQMAKMMPGGMPGGAGGFPFPPGGMKGFPGGAFSGMQPRGPLTPDARVSRGKVVDVAAERVDKG